MIFIFLKYNLIDLGVLQLIDLQLITKRKGTYFSCKGTYFSFGHSVRGLILAVRGLI